MIFWKKVKNFLNYIHIRTFNGHNSRTAWPIEMSSKNGLMPQSSGTIHTLDAKNRFTLKGVTRDTKNVLKNHVKLTSTWTISRVTHFYVNRFFASSVWIVPLDWGIIPFFELISIGPAGLELWQRKIFFSKFFGQNFKKIISSRQKIQKI
jgi:hypothetical protein